MSVRVVSWKPELGPGKWRVDIRFKKPDGTKVRNQTVHEAPTKGMACKWGEAREGQLRAGSLVLQTPEAKELPTFAAFVDDEWLPVYPAKAGNKHTTVREVTSHLKIHLKPFFGSTPIDKIDARMLDRFVAHMSKKMIGKPAATRTSRNGTLAAPRPMKPKRIKNVLGTLHTVLMTAHEWGTLAALPKFPKVKTSLPDFDFYNSTEVHQLLAAARDAEERAILMFACYTGARAGEQLALEWTAVDTRSKIVSFSRSRTRGVTTEGTKSGKPRKVPMRESLMAALTAIKHLKGPLVFCQADGTPLTLWILHDHLARAARRAQLRLLRWHDLRHSFASNLTIGGTPMRQVQEWMGHSTILMTMRYAHLAPGGGREFLAALDAPAPAKKDVAAE